jgi:hypothetical protein
MKQSIPMIDTPAEVAAFQTVDPEADDDALILAASWEERCLALPQRSASYRCQTVYLTVYEGQNDLREKHIRELEPLLKRFGTLEYLPATRQDPLPSVRRVIERLQTLVPSRRPKISIEISTFTRKHLLLLLNGLDHAGLLGNCQLYYTEPLDYQTHEDEAAATGISAIETIQTLSGSNRPSKNSLLVMFLGFEGRRALALWEHLEPHSTIAVIPDPPYHLDWRGRTELQNRYLLSCIPAANVYYSDALRPADSEKLLDRLIAEPKFTPEIYDYWIAPLGTRPQLIGAYRFWRKRVGLANVVYAAPVRYRPEYRTIAAGRSWLIENTVTWRHSSLITTHLNAGEGVP